jgi:hypothetical protein
MAAPTKKGPAKEQYKPVAAPPAPPAPPAPVQPAPPAPAPVAAPPVPAPPAPAPPAATPVPVAAAPAAPAATPASPCSYGPTQTAVSAPSPGCGSAPTTTSPASCALPQTATIQVYTFYEEDDAAGCRTEVPLANLRCEAVAGQTIVTGCTGTDGCATLAPVAAGLVTVNVAPSAALQDGRRLRTTTPADLLTQVHPGATQEIRAAYLPANAEIRLHAFLAPAAHHGGRQMPLAGVRFSIFEGPTAAGPLVREGLSTDEELHVVSNLHPSVHTVVATAPAALGGQQVTRHVQLTAGYSFDLPLPFSRARGAVDGLVCAQGTSRGIKGAQVQLITENGALQYRSTDGDGRFLFEDLAAGSHRLSFAANKQQIDGKTWVPPADAALEHVLAVKDGTLRPAPLLLAPDDHIIEARILTSDGQPIPYATVTIQNDRREQFQVTSADANGFLSVDVGTAGLYYVVVSMGPDGTPEKAQPFMVSSICKADVIVDTPGGGAGRSGGLVRGGSGGAGGDAVLDIPYPLLTESAMFPGGGAPVPSGGGAAQDSGALGQSVAATLRGVLGWRPRTGDTKGFLSALNQAFTLTDFEGHRDFKWTQPTFAVQPDMGGITGAQASIYTRAKAAVDQSLPLLEGLTPLRPDFNAVDCEAIRSVVRSELLELVRELGQDGGPRVQRVTSLFNLLLGSAPLAAVAHSTNPENVGGQLRRMRAEFGMDRSRINTIDEEQNLTNFLILVDYVTSLKQSWDSQRQFFNRKSGAEPYLGTQLVLVSRALGLLAETVQEIYFVMDSVFLGAADRQVVELQFAQEPLTIAELLSWVETVATEEGPRLIQEGGKTGVIALKSTIGQLADLAAGALIPPQDPSRLPAGYGTARVQRSMQELREHLRETAALIHSFHQTDPQPI